jgi:Tfp pilus assembly protein PilV
MPRFIHKAKNLGHLDQSSSGFILLEVLVAMSLIASSWMTLGTAYQQMVLRLGKSQEQIVQMKKEADQYELKVFAASQSIREIHHARGLFNEPSRVSRRPRPIPHPGGAIDKK